MTPQPEPTRRKIRRIGLVLDMEDGSKIMVYADGLTHAEVVVKTETPVDYVPGDMFGRRRPIGPPQTEITITGIEDYQIQWTDPDVKVSGAGRQLEGIRREVSK